MVLPVGVDFLHILLVNISLFKLFELFKLKINYLPNQSNTIGKRAELKSIFKIAANWNLMWKAHPCAIVYFLIKKYGREIYRVPCIHLFIVQKENV